MPRKDQQITPSVTQKLQLLGYNVADWDDSQTKNKITDEIHGVLKTASKKVNNAPGYPDRIYVNKKKNLLILVEEKSNIKYHDHENVAVGAIAGIKWYLTRFLNENLTANLKGFFNDWKILGIAVSGDLSQEYQHRFNCFTLDNQKIITLEQVTNFLTETQFLALFNSFDEEKAITSISSSSKKINNLLRSVDSQKRPILLSALMICLHNPIDKDYNNNFPEHYKKYSPDTLIVNIKDTVQKILRQEKIPEEKIKVLQTELAFLDTDPTLNNSAILKQILIELSEYVIPLFNNNFINNSNYDIIGRFYEEFLRYAGISNVKKGIVLTPRHITTLFTKLIDIKDNDKIVDLCCGTGAFLIAGMNALINKINNSNRSDKIDAIANVKNKQLLGFEINTTMFICAVSNMLFRGDGKSSIYNYDAIKDCKSQEILNEFKPTIGFINPPYSGKENKEDPTPKEITFLTKMLDNCSRYGVIIAPLSTYFKDDAIRKNILTKHTLKYVINMPNDLFQPNASTHTAIAVFETNRSFNYSIDEVTFIDLRDDGFVLSKNKGRTDIYGRWSQIEYDLLESLKPTSMPDEIRLVRTKIKPSNEWTIYAHSKTDYSALCEDDFIKSIGEYMVFQAKKNLGILDKNISEFDIINSIGSYYNENIKSLKHRVNFYPIKSQNKFSHKLIDTSSWKEFNFVDTKILWEDIKHGERLIKEDRIMGNIAYYSASDFNNGLTDSIDNPLFTVKNMIIYSTFGTAFWVEGEFTTSDEIYSFHNSKLNKFNALFIITIMRQNQYKFRFGRKAFKNKFENEIILLPTTPDGKPDWQYMEDYIKSLPFADRL